MVYERLSAIGRLKEGTAWVGFARTSEGFRLVFGEADGATRSSPAAAIDRTGLLLAVLAYFGEALAEPPPELEATQADVAEVVRWLAETEPEPQRRRMLRLALDAIDDGLAGEAVSWALARAAGVAGEAGEQADPVDLLEERYRLLGR